MKQQQQQQEEKEEKEEKVNKRVTKNKHGITSRVAACAGVPLSDGYDQKKIE